MSKKKNKRRNKRYNPTGNYDHLGLSGAWKQLYIQNSFNSKMIESNGTKKTHIAFNKLFLLYLKECQQKDYVPSKDTVEIEASKIFETAQRKVILTDIEPTRMDSKYVIDCIQNSTCESRVTTIDDGHNYKMLDVYMVIDCKKMSQDETNLLIKLLRGDFDSELDYMSFHALKLRVRGYPTEDKMNKIKSTLINNTLSVVKERFEFDGYHFDWDETLRMKLKRKWEIATM